MCGIFGWHLSNTNVSKSKRLVLSTVLALNNDNRGGDSWGFYSHENGASRGLGELLPFSHRIADHDVAMAHTRKATTGAKTVENSHPFDIGNFIGAHNGVIANHNELKTKYTGRDKFEVDSMHLFAHLDMGKSFDDLSGYGSIEFVRKSDKGKYIFLCKMSSYADLCIMGLGKDPNDTKGLVWSSNDRHLEQAMKAAGIECFKYEVKHGQVYYVSDDGCLMTTDIFGKLDLGYASSTNTTNYPYHGRNWSGGHGYGHDNFSREAWTKGDKRNSKTYYEQFDFDDDDEDPEVFISKNTGERYYKIGNRWVAETNLAASQLESGKAEETVVSGTSMALAIIDAAKAGEATTISADEWDALSDEEKLMVMPSMTEAEVKHVDKTGMFHEWKKQNDNEDVSEV